MDFKDYYQILGLERSASQDDIKRAYRRLARKFHPDVSKEANAEARFKEVGEAYEVLKDPEKRAAYNQLGQNWKAGEGFRPPPDWNTGFEQAGSAGDRAFDQEAYSDFFESLFGAGRAGGPGPAGAGRGRRGGDHHARIQISLHEAYHGGKRSLTLQMPKLDDQGRLQMQAHRVEVTIPKGVRAGQLMRLAGQGGSVPGGGAAGDLYLEIAFADDPRFRVELRDVFLQLPVAPWEAALGASVNLPTPSGVLQLKLPAGSQDGRKLRLKGKGIPGQPPGDLYAEVSVRLPPADTPEAKAGYEALASAFAGFDPRSEMEDWS